MLSQSFASLHFYNHKTSIRRCLVEAEAIAGAVAEVTNVIDGAALLLDVDMEAAVAEPSLTFHQTPKSMWPGSRGGQEKVTLGVPLRNMGEFNRLT